MTVLDLRAIFDEHISGHIVSICGISNYFTAIIVES